MTDAQLNEIIEYLESNGIECTPIGNIENDLFVDIYLDDVIRLKVSFCKGFPYAFPKVFILPVFYKKYKPLPHIDEQGYICTFDSNTTFPNMDKPEALVYESILKAKQIIVDGIKGVNRDDFLDEFTSYWNIDSKDNFKLWMLMTPPKSAKRYKYFYAEDIRRFYMVDDVDIHKEFVMLNSKVTTEIKFKECLYLPLYEKWYPPYPSTDGEVYEKLKKDKYAFSHYKNFLKNRVGRISLIVLSLDTGNERIFFGFIHRLVSNRNGFRNGKVNPDWQYTAFSKNRKIIKYDVSLLDQRRITSRGGDGTIYDKNVTVTGCGSIGGYLIQGLIDIGISKFTLIDREYLVEENIARHICGASFVGQNKTEAIKEMLKQHYPYFECESIPKDIFDVFSNISTFNQADYNFVVVGNIPIEVRFLELFEAGSINKPLIIIWVEPYLVGGHAVVLNRTELIGEKIFGDEYTYKFNVIVNGSDYIKREAGCQSTYTPYSGYEAKMFLYDFLDYFQKEILLKEDRKNVVFSWGGRLQKARKDGMKLNDYWLSKADRTVRIIEL